MGNAAISPKEGSTTAPVPATGSAAVSVLLKDYKPRSEQTTPALESNTKRRRLYGREHLALKRELRMCANDYTLSSNITSDIRSATRITSQSEAIAEIAVR